MELIHKETVNSETVDLELSSLSGEDNKVYHLTPYVKQSINVGHDFIDVPALQKEYPHLAPLNSESYNYADVELVLGQDAFAAIHPLVLRNRFEELTDSRSSSVRMGCKRASSFDHLYDFDMFQS